MQAEAIHERSVRGGATVSPETIAIRGSAASAADWLLRASLFLFALGTAVALMTRAGSSIGEIALMDWGVSHSTIFLVERVTGAAFLVLAASMFVFPTVFAALVIAAVTFAEAYAGYLTGGHAFYQLTPFAEALRYLAPLALVPLVVSRKLLPRDSWRNGSAAWILRVGLAIVFCAHGLEALGKSAVFIDLILGSMRGFGLSLSESAASQLLLVIGWVDIAVAILVLVRPSRPVLAWLCFWAAITAFSRPLSLGWGSYPEVLLRASHILAPIALGCLLQSNWRETAASRKAASVEPATSGAGAVQTSSSAGSSTAS